MTIDYECIMSEFENCEIVLCRCINIIYKCKSNKSLKVVNQTLNVIYTVKTV